MYTVRGNNLQKCIYIHMYIFKVIALATLVDIHCTISQLQLLYPLATINVILRIEMSIEVANTMNYTCTSTVMHAHVHTCKY